MIEVIMPMNIPAELSIDVCESIWTLLDSGSAEECGSHAWRISNAVERYLAIVEHDMPTLTIGEWCAIIDTLNGTFLDSSKIRCMWMEIADHEPGFLEQKWKIERKVLIERLKTMPAGSRMAVAEVAHRFWSSEDARCGATYREVLTRLGARVAPEENADLGDLQA
jgi:hypothetical protein